MFFDKERPLFTISITADILKCHPRTLRIYDDEGFVSPKRKNNVRYYSQEDVETLKDIMKLMNKWNLNIYGVHALIEMAERFDITIDKVFKKMLD